MLHHAFIKYDGSLKAQELIALILADRTEANKLTLFGDSAIELAIQHKTTAV